MQHHVIETIDQGCWDGASRRLGKPGVLRSRTLPTPWP